VLKRLKHKRGCYLYLYSFKDIIIFKNFMSHLDCIKKTPEKNIGPLSKVQSFLISKYTFMKMGEKKCA